MRLSVNRDDVGYRPYRMLPRGVLPVVRLNGSVVNQCITADTRMGFVLVEVPGIDGHLVLNTRRDAVVRRRLYGRVDIDLVRH
ncbi:hypothetical protein D3C85_1050820 [compost metagenome]